MFDTDQPESSTALLGAGAVSAETGSDAGSGLPGLLALSDEALETELATHAAHIASAECRFCLLVAEVERRGFWAAQGASTPAQWLSWRCGTSPSVAKEHLRVGRALQGLPRVREAFAKGELSYSKVRALTRIATEAMEERLVEMAGLATAAQLETIVRAYRRSSPAEAGPPATAGWRRRVLHHHEAHDGTVVITVVLAKEDAATVLGAIEATACVLGEDERDDARAVSAETASSAPVEPDGAPTSPAGARRADALVAICEAALARGVLLPSAHGPHAAVVVHVDEAVLEDPSAEGCSFVEGVGVVSSHTVQRLACDASVSRLRYRRDGTCVPEGKTRQTPLSLRRAVLARDAGCRWPGCGRRRYVQVHHVVWVSRRGRTRLTNLVTLCSFHHHLAHEGGYRLEMDRRCRVHVLTPAGKRLEQHNRLPGTAGESLAERHERAGLHLDEATMPTGGGPYDLDLTIDVLLAAAATARAHPGGWTKP